MENQVIVIEEGITPDTLKYILDISKTCKDVTKNLRHLIEYPFDKEQWGKFNNN